MANREIQTFFDMASLQVASESLLVNLGNGSSLEGVFTVGNTVSSRLPGPVIAGWVSGQSPRLEVVAHQDLTLNPARAVGGSTGLESGFSAALFYDTRREQYTLSFRSTEFDQSIRDAGDIEADVEIGLFGWAFSQLHSAEAFWDFLVRDAPLPAGGLVIPEAARLANFRAAVAGGSRVNVTGYSLGANLATAFTELHPDSVENTYLFNGAGTGLTRAGLGLGAVWERYQAVFDAPGAGTGYSLPPPNLVAMASASLLAFGQLQPDSAIAMNSRHQYALDAIAPLLIGAPDAQLLAIGDAQRHRHGFNGKIFDIWSEDHLDTGPLESVVASSGIRHGQPTPIWYENQALASVALGSPWFDWGTGHSIALLYDSLAVMATFEQLAPDVTQEDLGKVLGIAADREYLSLENAGNALARLFNVPGLEASEVADSALAFADIEKRNALHGLLVAIQETPLFQAFAGGSTEGEPGPARALLQLVDSPRAFDSVRSDFGQFLSLHHLAPFSLSLLDESLEDAFLAAHPALALDWLHDRALSEADRAAGLSRISDRYIEDRILFTTLLAERNREDSLNANSLTLRERYSDASLGVAFNTYWEDYNQPPRAQVAFGSSENDMNTLPTSQWDDRVYGMAGDDTIAGQAGADYLEGGNGRDVLVGGEGLDTLVGGAGDDILEGGAGADLLVGGPGDDVFRWSAGDGDDIIGDFDTGADRILVDGQDLSLLNFSRVAPDSALYRDPNRPGLLLHFDGGELAVQVDSGTATGSVRVLQYAEGSFGISLDDTLSHPSPPTQFTVLEIDTLPVIGDQGSGAALLSSFRRSRQQFRDWTDVAIQFDANVVSHFASDPLNPYVSDGFEGGDEADYLVGDAAANALVGMLGDDVIGGGPGNDLLIGGTGSDFLEGGVGDDIVFGSFRSLLDLSSDPYPEELYFYHRMFDTAGDVNIIHGGAGNDRLHGGEYADHISGGDDDDIIYAGTGTDVIEGGSGNDTLFGDSGFTTFGLDMAAPGFFRSAWVDGAGASGGFDDELFGGAGNDTLSGELGDDTLFGGAGDDLLVGDRQVLAGMWPATGGTTQALGIAFHGDDSLYGGAGNDTLRGLAGDDRLSGGAGELNYLYGGAGNDVYEFVAGDGASRVEDYEGQSTLLFTGVATDSVKIAYLGDTVLVGTSLSTSGFQLDRESWDKARIAIGTVENVQPRARFDTFYYDSSGQTLLLSIEGLFGITDAQRDAVFHVDHGDPARPSLVVAGGVSEFFLETHPTGAFPGHSQLLLATLPLESVGLPFGINLGIPPEQVEHLALPAHTVLERNGDGVLHGGAGADRIQAGSANDQLRGMAGDDYLAGGAGDDYISGGQGDDRVVGGTGDDFLVARGNEGSDTFLFAVGDGRDVLSIAHENDFLPRRPLGRIVFQDIAAGESLGFRFNASFSADSDSTIYYGLDDQITLDVANGRRPVESALHYFTLGSDYDPGWVPVIRPRTASTERQVLYGSFGKDQIYAGESGATISPGYGDDEIFGGAGDDEIVLNAFYVDKAFGGIGSKSVTPGEGNDDLVTPLAQGLSYHYAAGDGHDVITYDWSTTIRKRDYNLSGPAGEFEWYAPYQIGHASGALTFEAYGSDSLILGAGIAMEDTRFIQYGHDLLISIGASNGSITVENFFVPDATETPGYTVADIADGGPVVDSVESLVHLGVMAPHPLESIEVAGVAYAIDTLVATVLEDGAVAPRVSTLGTAGPDTLQGAAISPDIILGEAGDDVITDLGGLNTIEGGSGADTITVAGTNFVSGEAGDDVVALLRGVNVVSGGAGDDRITVHDGINHIDSGVGKDRIFVDGGVNTLHVYGSYPLAINPFISPTDVTLSGGDNTVTFGAEDDVLRVGGVPGYTGSNSVDMGGGDDFAFVSGGVNVIDAGAGDDALVLVRDNQTTVQFGRGSGADTVVVASENPNVAIDFGPGITAQDVQFSLVPDVAGLGHHFTSPYYSGDYRGSVRVTIADSGDSLTLVTSDNLAQYWATYRVRVTAANGAGASAFLFGDGTALSGEEVWALATRPAGSVLEGTPQAESIVGTDGADTITGYGGNDTLEGLAGDDVFINTGSANGIDLIRGGAGFDTIVSADSAAHVQLGNFRVEDSIERIESTGTNVIRATDGSDWLDFSQTEFVGIAGIAAGAGDDIVVGADTTLLIDGGGGDDLLTGGAADNILYGGEGDDLFIVQGDDGGSDVIIGGAGYDTVVGGDGADTLRLAAHQPGFGLEEINLGGSFWRNVVSGTDSADSLDFTDVRLANVFLVSGGAGDDTLVGSSLGFEVIWGGVGDDDVVSGSGADLYLLSPGSGLERIHNHDGDAAQDDALALVFASHESVWLSRDNQDLVVDLVGRDDRAVLVDWYAGAEHQLGRLFDATHQIDAAGVETLVAAMATFDVPTGVGAFIPPEVQEALAPTLASVWVPL